MSAPSRNEPRFVEELLGAARVEARGSLVFVERAPLLAAEPAPRAIEVLDGAMTSSGTDRGWILRPAEALADALVVDETDQPLQYVVRRFGATGGTELPAPDGDTGSWVLRGAACGTDRCAVVRWSPRPGETSKPTQTERIAISVIAADGALERTFAFEAAGFHTGTTWFGGVAASPARDDVYLLEREGVKPAVRAVDMATGDTRWRSVIEPLEGDPGRAQEARLVVAADGTSVGVAQGFSRGGFLDRRRLAVLDPQTGAPIGNVDRPNGPGALLPVPGTGDLLVLQISVTSDIGDSPDRKFRGVRRLEPKSGWNEPAYDAPETALVPAGGVVLGDGTLLLYRIGLREPYEQDLPEARRIARGDAVDALHSPP